MTGAAYVGWEGSYSFNVSGRDIPVETVNALKYPQMQPSGQLDFTASGSGLFESPRYDVRLGVEDLYIRDEGVGAVTMRLGVRNNTLNLEMDAASPRLVVAGSGQIALTPQADAELTFRVTDTSLDPYVRAFQPNLSPFTTAVASGTVRVSGELRNPEHLLVDAQVDALNLQLFDYVGEERRTGARLLRSAGGQDRAAAARWRGHAARRRRHGRARHERDRDQGDRRRQPRHPAGIHARRPQLGSGRPALQRSTASWMRRSSRARRRSRAAAFATSRCRTRSTRSTARWRSTPPACGSTG